MKREDLIQAMDTYGTYLKKSAFHVLHDLQLAEDMVQETFISFYQKGQFKGQSQLKTYLYSILMNHIKMHLRKNKIKEVSEIHFTSQETMRFEHQVINTMDLSRAIQALDDHYKMVIVMFYFDDLTIEDIASIMKKSKASVKMALKRGRDHLRLSLGGTYENKIN